MLDAVGQAVMLGVALPTTMDCCACAAALKLAFPAWLASITQVPAPVKVTVPDEIEQPVLVASRVIAAVSPEVAVAAGVYVPPIAGFAGAVVVKLTVWTALEIVNGVALEVAPL